MTHRTDDVDDARAAEEVMRLCNEIGLAATPELAEAMTRVFARFEDRAGPTTVLLASVNAVARLLRVLCHEASAAEPVRGPAMCAATLTAELGDVYHPGRQVH
jgi:hypothetical protein